MVDLFDTTTSVDVHINKELIRLGIAWPDLRKNENSCAVSHLKNVFFVFLFFFSF